MLTPLAFGMPGLAEWIIIAALGLLFFGKRLPEVGRGLGRSILEFKKGLKGVEEDASPDTEVPAPRLSAGASKPQAIEGDVNAERTR